MYGERSVSLLSPEERRLRGDLIVDQRQDLRDQHGAGTGGAQAVREGFCTETWLGTGTGSQGRGHGTVFLTVFALV